MVRLKALVPEELDSAQREIHDRIVGGPRKSMNVSLTDEAGSLIGPFNAYLHTPELGARLEAAGVGLREATQLSPVHREIAILASARFHRARFEWVAHAKIARDVGVSDAVIEAIHAAERPPFAAEDEAAVFEFAMELLETHRVGDATYARLAAHLDERERVELVFVLGYYALVSMTLNTFEVRLPRGVTDPFPDAPGPAFPGS